MNMMKSPLPAFIVVLAAAMLILPTSALDVTGNSDDLVLFSVSDPGFHTITMQYTGYSPFVVTLEDYRGYPIEYLAISPGPFQGEVQVNLAPGDYYLLITASGPWSIAIAPPDSPPVITTIPTTYVTTAIPTITPTPTQTFCSSDTCPDTIPPTIEPTEIPTSVPTTVPSVTPTTEPTGIPTSVPTSLPSVTPTTMPTTSPTTEPTAVPTTGPTMEPQIPHLFYGSLTIMDEPGAAGTTLTATVEGGGGSLTTTTEGLYGNASPLAEKLIVQGSIGNGAPISFSANGQPAECYDVKAGGPWQSTYPFASGALTELNLRITEPGDVYFINATAGNGGNIVPRGLVTVSAGANMTFTITPLSGYTTQDVVVDSVSKGAIPTYTFVQVSANHTISASFRQTSGGGGGGDNGGTPVPTTPTTIPTTQAGGTTFLSSGGAGSGSVMTPNVTQNITVTTTATTSIPTDTPTPVQSFWDRYPEAGLIALLILVLLLSGYAYYSYQKEQAGNPPEEK